MLNGGHPNSLDRTVEIVEIIFQDASRFAELYHCYFSKDEVARLHTSNAMKRIYAEHPQWLKPHLDHLVNDEYKSVAGRAKKLQNAYKKS